MANDNRPEPDENPSQEHQSDDSAEMENPVDGSEWVSESEVFPESEDQHSIDLNGNPPVPSHHPTGDPEQTGGWWGDVPFTRSKCWMRRYATNQNSSLGRPGDSSDAI